MYMTIVKSPIYMPGQGTRDTAAWDARITRVLDISVAVLALAFFLPLMLLIAVLVYVTDPGPVFFAHRRIGKGGRHFRCLKFRSMAVDAEARLAELLASDPDARAEWARDHKLKHDPRITMLGALLRKSSLDELPQIFNVLRGEMSLVGLARSLTPKPCATAATSPITAVFGPESPGSGR